MKLHRTLLVVVVGVLAGTSSPVQASGLELKELKHAAVAINCRKEGQRGGYFGTGVLVHPQGYVLTSTTVVPPGASAIRCHFVGTLNRPADLVLTDESLEVAVVKVAEEDLPRNARTVALRRSESLAIGDTAFSYGDALVSFVQSGQFTISVGTVSGLYETTRIISPQSVYLGPVIETTATMAAGMDGGPLFDGGGNVIGLLSLNVHQTRWLGTAVPVDAFLDVLETALAEHGAAALRKRRAAASRRLAVVDETGPSLFPVRARVNARFAQAAKAISGSMVRLRVDRAEDRKTRSRGGQPRRRSYRSIVERPDAPVLGWLVSEQGHVLTTWFNVWGKLNGIDVVLPDGEPVEAELLGHDEHKDLAVVRFDPAVLDDASEVQPLELTPGELATGAPIGVVGLSPDGGHTLTRGIVSATGRLDGVAVQIDAPVNYGAAGGALLDMNGQCVGMATHVRTRSLWSQNSGVGMAVESAAILDVLERLKNDETITKPKRGFIGIRMSSGSLETRGVVVEQVLPDTPAQDAGLKADDLVVAVDGERIEDQADLAKAVSRLKPGTKIRLSIRRGDRTREIELVLDEHPYR